MISYKKNQLIYFLLLGTFLINACQSDIPFKTHDLGYRYIFFKENKEAPQAKIGDILILEMDYYLNNDSLLFSTRDFSNDYKLKLKKVVSQESTIDDALATMHEGDSACFVMNANLFYSITRKQRVPFFVKQSDEIYFYIKLKKITNIDAYFKKKSREEKETPEGEMKKLEHFLKTANITAEASPTGLYKVEEYEGKGPKAKYGSSLKLHYNGYFVNGESFSNTFNSKPFEVKLGKDDLILGFEEGLVGMQKGGQYKLIIPSHLAYGEKGNSAVPPLRTLIFDIQVMDIK